MVARMKINAEFKSGGEILKGEVKGEDTDKGLPVYVIYVKEQAEVYRVPKQNVIRFY